MSKPAGNVAAVVIKKAVEKIVPLAKPLIGGIFQIVLWAFGIVGSVIKGVFGYLAEHVIIMLAVAALVIMQIIAKNAGSITHRAKNFSK